MTAQEYERGDCALQDGAAERKADVKRRQKEEAAAAAALRSLAAKEAQQSTLLTARLELESLRVLLERIGRRERIKMQGTFACRSCPYTCCSMMVGELTHGGVGQEYSSSRWFCELDFVSDMEQMPVWLCSRLMSSISSQIAQTQLLPWSLLVGLGTGCSGDNRRPYPSRPTT